MTCYGYIRVSTREQNEARQIDAMRKAGITDENMFIDKASGKDFDRKEYVRMIYTLKQGDTVFIMSIDRLGRNYDAILNEWNAITKKIQANIVVLDMPLLDTRDKENGLTGRLISDIVLQLLSYVAETERTNIRQRQAEGIAAAKVKGVRFGRPPKPLPENFHQVYQQWKAGKITGVAAAKACGMPLSTFHYRAGIYGMDAAKSHEIA